METRTGTKGAQTRISRRGALLGVGGLLAAGAAAQVAASSSASAAGPATPLGIGSSGWYVEQFQAAMNANGYWCGTVDGQFGELTQQAVYAVQKTHGLARTGKIDAALWNSGLARVRARSRYASTGIEIDKTRQLLLVVASGYVQYAFNTSTGNGERLIYNGRWYTAVTPSGTFRVNRYGSNGWDYGALGGLWRPRYFNGGIAVHGSGFIPPYPDSHGCCRLSTRAQDFLLASGREQMGSYVRVY